MPDSGSKPSLPSAADTALKLAGDWNLVAVEGTPITALYKPHSRHNTPNLSVTPEGRVAGFGGVNRIMSALDLQALARGEFLLGPVASTMMAGPVESMNFEKRYTSLLSKARAYALSGDTLTLKDPAGAELLRFVRPKAK